MKEAVTRDKQVRQGDEKRQKGQGNRQKRINFESRRYEEMRRKIRDQKRIE